MESARSPLDSPFCKHLRSKKWYFRKGPPATIEDAVDGSRHCWCHRTWETIGPDDDPAHPEDCVRGRGCFEPLFLTERPAIEA
jgi:hypothetical protein